MIVLYKGIDENETVKKYQYKFYSLSAMIAIGYRINSGRATQFRQWAIKILDTFTKQGYVLDKSRLINGQIRRHIPMTMADWKSKLDAFLQFNDTDIFEQYRVIQDYLYQSDFDRL